MPFEIKTAWMVKKKKKKKQHTIFKILELTHHNILSRDNKWTD